MGSAQAGNPKARRATVRAMMLTAVAAALVALAGCTSGSSTSSEAFSGDPAAAEPAPDRFSASSPAAGSSGTDGGEATGAPGRQQLATLPVDGSKVIRTAELAVKLHVAPVPATDDATADGAANAAARSAAVATASASARSIANSAGGFQSSADGGGSQMTISLRVPSDQYSSVVDRLAALGEPTNRTESSRDVTAEMVDVQSRVDSMTASVARVRALLAQATNIADVISIESELSTREADLESLQQQRAFLDGQVAMSTVTLTLSAVTDDATPAGPADVDSGFIAGLHGGWAAFLGFVGWIGGAIGALLPFLPLLAAAVLLAYWLTRRLRRRARRGGPHPTDSPAPAGSPTGNPEPAAAAVGAGSS